MPTATSGLFRTLLAAGFAIAAALLVARPAMAQDDPLADESAEADAPAGDTDADTDTDAAAVADADSGSPSDEVTDSPPPAGEIDEHQLSRAAGWSFSRASTHHSASLWLTHWNNDFDTFLHDLHVGVQVGFDLGENLKASAHTILGFRFQSSSAATGFDNLWIGGKLLFLELPQGQGRLGVSTTFGLPIGKHEDFGGSNVDTVFTDGTSGFWRVDAFTWDIAGLWTMLLGESMALNTDVHFVFAFDQADEFGLTINGELVVRLDNDVIRMDLRGGLMISTMYIPFQPYVEANYLFYDFTFTLRSQFGIGSGDNLGNIGDWQLYFVANWRFGGTPGPPQNG